MSLHLVSLYAAAEDILCRREQNIQRVETALSDIMTRTHTPLTFTKDALVWQSKKPPFFAWHWYTKDMELARDAYLALSIHLESYFPEKDIAFRLTGDYTNAGIECLGRDALSRSYQEDWHHLYYAVKKMLDWQRSDPTGTYRREASPEFDRQIEELAKIMEIAAEYERSITWKTISILNGTTTEES